jgi:hypothetical protein
MIRSLKLIGAGLLVLCAVSSQAWIKLGNVYCDANTNGVIDSNDAPVQSALVVVTNTSGTFSNSSWTTAEGFFIMNIPDVTDHYVDFVVSATLPAGTTFVPLPNSFTATSEIVTNNFLIENPGCVTGPGGGGGGGETNSSSCWLTGGGTIKNGKGKPIFTFGGVINPGCNPQAAGGGNWNVIDHTSNLHFKGLDIQVLNCGNVSGVTGSSSPKTQFSFIDFEGVGTLKGIAKNKTDYGLIHFTGRAEDLGEPGKNIDRLYLRVFDGSGNTLLLISGNVSNPLEVSPLLVSTGNLQMHSCKHK